MTDSTSLDTALDAWVQAVRLDDDEIDRLRRSIVAQVDQPAGLPTQWWRTLSFQVADVMVRAHRQPALAFAGWPS